MGIGKDFIKQTTLKNTGKSGRMLGEPKPDLVLGEGGYLQIELPNPKDFTALPKDVRIAIESRESIRDYSEDFLNLAELSYLLWCSHGIKKVIKDIVTLRNVPSAGARHPFETYILVNRVYGLEPGLYHYLPLLNKLEFVKAVNKYADEFVVAFDDQSHIKESAATFIWVASEKRTTWVYSERGYRYIFLDAGHICQNLYLCAESINCGVCAVAHFDDERVNELLDVDTDEQFTVYAATVGKQQNNN